MVATSPLTRIKEALDDLPAWLDTRDDAGLSQALIELREVIDRGEAVFASGFRRLEKSGQYRVEGALSVESAAKPA